MNASVVAVVRCEDYAQVGEAIKRSLELLGGLEKFVGKDKRVMLKPNICDPLPPEKAATTHPSVVRAVTGLALSITKNVCVGEQTASNENGLTKKAFMVSGIARVAAETGVTVRDLQTEHFIQKDIPSYQVLEKTDFCKALLEQDLVINLPKFKTHGLTYVTGSVKNCFGLIHPDERNYLHKRFPSREDFSQGIVDVFSVVKPALTIMDAVVCMEGDEGPSYGSPRKVGYVIASEDSVAVDAVASHITGHNPMAVLTTRYANDRKLGVGDIGRIRILGDQPEIIKDFRQHSSYTRRMKDNKGAQPAITGKCVRCGACFQKCPVGAIEDIDGKYVINEGKCIRCYCCVEVCVHGAVGLGKAKTAGADLIRLGIRCNEDCLFCTAKEEKEKELTTEEAKKNIEMVAEMGCGTVAFTGGEPTIRGDLPELVGFAKSKGIHKVEIQTNGVRLADSAYVDKLIAAGADDFFVALHSHRRTVSDTLTNSRGFDDTITGIKNLLSFRRTVMLSYVINTENFRETDMFVDYVAENLKGISKIHFGFIRPNGQAWKHKSLVPKLSISEPYLDRAFRACKKRGIHFEVEGMPLCYMPDFIGNNVESARMEFDPCLHIEKGVVRKDTHSRHMSEDKAKSKACQICRFDAICPGVWREYALIHGTAELYPILGEKDG